MTYKETISYLYSLQKHGIKLGLRNTLSLLSMLGNPQLSFRSVHIAGTNGKGSVSAMTASMLRSAGQRVGLFTSPHLVSFTERIKVNNAEITEAEVVGLAEEIMLRMQDAEGRMQAEAEKPGIPEYSLNPTFFEFVTAIAFLYFMRKGVNWAVIETGMGGRLDATNILLPEVSVITRIGYDHREFLGNTLKEIASEKAGIIKRNIPVVSAAHPDEAMKVVREKAHKMNVPLYVYGEDFASHSEVMSMHGITLGYKGVHEFRNLHLSLCGDHQIENASIAIKAIELVTDDSPERIVREGLSSTVWPGRLELIECRDDLYDILIDGAHNPDAAEALAVSVRKYFLPYYERLVLVLGVMSDKDTANIMRPLLPLASEIIFTAPDYERAAPPEKLADTARHSGFDSTSAGSVGEAVELAVKKAGLAVTGDGQKKNLILITGSFYTIGEAKSVLGFKTTAPSLSGLR